MPREHKKRGRREQSKRERDEDVTEVSPKRQLVTDIRLSTEPEIQVEGDAGDDFIRIDTEEAVPGGPQNEFYGILKPEEQEYYAHVNSKISANDFESDDDRALFIQAVHRETQGKEMMVASSQSSSRYLEKIICLSTSTQLEGLFSAFLTNLNYLIQHRFGSHCCETLFAQAARHVTSVESRESDDSGLESLFIQAAKEIEPNIGFLLTERFASHTIRVLLLVLSGESLDDESTQSMIASRRKEKLDLPQTEPQPMVARKVPKSFKQALYHIINAAVSTIDTTYLRALATHPVGNPILQLLFKLELTADDKSKGGMKHALADKLLPDTNFEPDSESSRFIQGLIYDPTGSHLVETMIQYLPGKMFKKLYKNLLKDRMRNMSKNDIANYVAIKVLERLSKDDLAQAVDMILPEVQGLVARSRTGLLKVLFERCAVRQVDATPLVEEIGKACGTDIVTVLPRLLQFNASVEDFVHSAPSEDENVKEAPTKADVHGSLLAQAMLQIPGDGNLVQQSILAQPEPTFLLLSKNAIASRVLQLALTSDQSSSAFRRQLVPKFFGHAVELAQNPSGSRVIDAVWEATSDLHFLKQRIARELQDDEAALRNSIYGRRVWQNWAMDTYSRRPAEWQSIAKVQRQQPLQLGDRKTGASEKSEETVKTAIELARERHAAKHPRREDKHHAIPSHA